MKNEKSQDGSVAITSSIEILDVTTTVHEPDDDMDVSIEFACDFTANDPQRVLASRFDIDVFNANTRCCISSNVGSLEEGLNDGRVNGWTEVRNEGPYDIDDLQFEGRVSIFLGKKVVVGMLDMPQKEPVGEKITDVTNPGISCWSIWANRLTEDDDSTEVNLVAAIKNTSDDIVPLAGVVFELLDEAGEVVDSHTEMTEVLFAGEIRCLEHETWFEGAAKDLLKHRIRFSLLIFDAIETKDIPLFLH